MHFTHAKFIRNPEAYTGLGIWLQWVKQEILVGISLEYVHFYIVKEMGTEH
jgi:hypothetical protein